jgi:hypothetical protein
MPEKPEKSEHSVVECAGRANAAKRVKWALDLMVGSWDK